MRCFAYFNEVKIKCENVGFYEKKEVQIKIYIPKIEKLMFGDEYAQLRELVRNKEWFPVVAVQTIKTSQFQTLKLFNATVKELSAKTSEDFRLKIKYQYHKIHFIQEDFL